MLGSMQSKLHFFPLKLDFEQVPKTQVPKSLHSQSDEEPREGRGYPAKFCTVIHEDLQNVLQSMTKIFLLNLRREKCLASVMVCYLFVGQTTSVKSFFHCHNKTVFSSIS